MNCSTISPPEFFAPENANAIEAAQAAEFTERNSEGAVTISAKLSRGLGCDYQALLRDFCFGSEAAIERFSTNVCFGPQADMDWLGRIVINQWGPQTR